MPISVTIARISPCSRRLVEECPPSLDSLLAHYLPLRTGTLTTTLIRCRRARLATATTTRTKMSCNTRQASDRGMRMKRWASLVTIEGHR